MIGIVPTDFAKAQKSISLLRIFSLSEPPQICQGNQMTGFYR